MDYAQVNQHIRGPGTTPRTATIQITRGNLCLVFHLPQCCPRWSDGELHPDLRAFLLNRAYTKVGCNINGDVRKLEKDF